jgi:hypothetical protein
MVPELEEMKSLISDLDMLVVVGDSGSSEREK